MWLSMAPEVDPAAEPIQDHAAALDQQHARKSSTFVGVGAPQMLIPFNMRSRTQSWAASASATPSLGLGGSIASLKVSDAVGQSSQDQDQSDEEPCCTPDHTLANDAMLLLASSTTSSSLRDTSVGLPSSAHGTTTSAVKLVKTPAGTSERRRLDYFTMSAADTTSNSSSASTSVAQSSPPTFDFRNTFAPLAFNKRSSSRTSPAATKINGSGGIEFGGRQWMGKTAHAVEQEMEALGDRVIMSFAPDATYLAQRLEMLRRNLEASNWERRPTWVGWQEEDEAEESAQTQSDQQVADTDAKPAVEDAKDATESLRQSQESGTTRQQLSSAVPARLRAATAKSEFSLPPAPATSLIEAEYARGAHLPVVSNIEGASLSAAERTKLARASLLRHSGQTQDDALEESEPQEAMSASADETAVPETPPPLDRTVRAAALDARLEIRQLKRDDLVQVRELHCYHGDGNKSPGRETYTMSAGFLLRLLVDEKHVAVVAVKRPIPAPESPLPSDLASSIHSRFSSNQQTQAPWTARTGSPGLLRTSSALMYSVARSNSSMEALDDEEEENRSPTSPSFFSSPDDAIGGTRTELTQATSLPTSERDEAEDDAEAASEPVGLDPATPDAGASAGTGSGTARDEVNHSAGKVDEAALPAHGLALPPSALPQSDSTLYESDADKPVLAGPLPVAPPVAVRVMAAPPASLRKLRAAGNSLAADALLEGTETVVGVATAQLTTTEPLANELWPGIDADDTSERGAAVEVAHVLTLSVARDERSQGLGARLLERLLEECQVRIGHNSLRKPESISVSGRARSMRAIVECHPSNERAVELYTKAGFHRVEGPQGTRKNFYRGDDRIPLAYRLKAGGTDAHVYERLFELP